MWSVHRQSARLKTINIDGLEETFVSFNFSRESNLFRVGFRAKYGDGGVKHMFEQKGLIETNLLGVENELEQATDNAIEAGAEDVTLFADLKLEFVCSSTAFTNVQNNLVKLKYKIISANIDYVPFKTQLLNETDLETCSNMYDRLEAMQEVVKLYDNIA